MKDNYPNYLNLHNIDPAHIEPPTKSETAPVKPVVVDDWVMCPDCGSQPGIWVCGGVSDGEDGGPMWVGPSYCPTCGQPLDLSDLNDPTIERRIERIPGFDSIRPGQRNVTVGVVGRGCRHFALDAERVKQMLHGSLFYPHDQEKLLDIQPITMSNAEAIEILKHIEADIYGRIAIGKAIDALIGPWVKTTDRLPTEADADRKLNVFVRTHSGGHVVNYQSVIESPDFYPWWMPIPPLPEKEEQEPWPGDDLDCPNCGAMLELVDGGMLECRLCGFSDNDTAEV